MSAVTDYVPVGLLSELRFAGVYDGGNFRISGLRVNQKVSGMPAGLFGFVGEGAVIKEVVIDGIAITSSSYYTGAVAGDVKGSVIEDCVVTSAEISNTGAPASGDLKDNSLTGGIVGHAYEGVVRNCSFDSGTNVIHVPSCQSGCYRYTNLLLPYQSIHGRKSNGLHMGRLQS